MSSRPATAQEFWGTIWATELGPVEVTRLATGPHEMRRTARHIAARDPERVWLSLQLAGTSIVTCGDRTAVLRAGDLTLYDSSTPYKILSPRPIEMATFQLPRRLVRLPSQAISRAAATRIAADEPAGLLVGPFLRQLAETLTRSGPPAQAADLGEAVLHLVRAMYAPLPAAAPVPHRVSDTGTPGGGLAATLL